MPMEPSQEQERRQEQEQEQEQEKKLLEPYAYIQELPGKKVRSKLVDAFQLWLNVPESPKQTIGQIVDELHNASLLIDDIEDNSELRRGRPAAHRIFGVPATINCANYVYFKSLKRCQSLCNDQAMQVYTEEMLRLHQGQGLDIFWRDHCQCPTEEEYMEMVKNKTGGLFRLAVGLLQAFSDCRLDFTHLLNAIAMYFQIRDDYINLLDEEYMENKSFCEDLTEGKFSFPLIAGIRSDPLDTRLLNILKQHTTDVELKKYAVQFMRDKGAFDRTRTKLNELYQDIQGELNQLGGNALLEHIISSLHATLK